MAPERSEEVDAGLVDADRWPRFQALLVEALEREGDERARFLAEIERGEPALARELARWIALEPEARGFLEGSPRRSASHRIPLGPGARIGRYEVTAVLGSGGSAVVLEARQRDPERKVALKVFQGAAVDGVALRRFRGEAELLARLHHSGIAQVYETGSVDDEHGARPFIAIELVEGGVELSRAARELGLEPRLRLFLELCDAVAHAHEHGVVHRDLKPQNVLVDRTGRLKVIDFGVARLQAEEPRLTAPGELLGTPAYMSPEQQAGDPCAVGTRSDVYSLGVLLRELCVERTPNERATRLPRDLEAIERTARAESPARRYATAHELAADLRRFLAHEPVLARPPGFAHQLALLARRHRGPMIALAAGLLLFAASLVAASWRIARVQSAERAKAELVTEFLSSLLESGRPSAGGSAEFGLRELLDEADRRLETELAGAPEARSELRATLGIAYRELGEYERAVQQLRRALAVRGELGGDRGAERAGWLNCLGDVLASAGRSEEAEHVLREAAALEERDPETPRIFRGITAHHLARALLGRGALGEARAEAERARSIYVEELGAEHEAVGGVERTLGEIAREAGDLPRAERHGRAALERALALHGNDSLQAADARLDLARTLSASGGGDEARELLASARLRLASALPPGHPRLQLAERLAAGANEGWEKR